MEERYRIAVNIKTPHGMQEIGSYLLGGDKYFAKATFALLEGKETLDETAVLRVDLVEQKTGDLDVILKSLSCTLNEQAENCKVITRELFKFLNLEL